MIHLLPLTGPAGQTRPMLARFLVYGALGWIVEILWTGMGSILRRDPRLTRARTGAMFSMTLCLASASHAPTMTAPIAPHGSSHVVRKSSMSSPMERKVSAVSALKTGSPAILVQIGSVNVAFQLAFPHFRCCRDVVG